MKTYIVTVRDGLMKEALEGASSLYGEMLSEASGNRSASQMVSAFTSFIEEIFKGEVQIKIKKKQTTLSQLIEKAKRLPEKKKTEEIKKAIEACENAVKEIDKSYEEINELAKSGQKMMEQAKQIEEDKQINNIVRGSKLKEIDKKRAELQKQIRSKIAESNKKFEDLEPHITILKEAVGER